MTMQNKFTTGLLLAPAIILLIPFIAMQFTGEVDWSTGDFAVMGVLLYGAVFSYLFLSRMVTEPQHRIIIGTIIALAVLWLWAELAVGIFTNWGS